MGILILILIIIFGYIPFSKLFKKTKVSNPIPYFFLYGSLLVTSFLYVVSAYIVHSLFQGLVITLSFLTGITIVFFVKKVRVQVSITHVLFFTAFTLFFYFITQKTFQYHDHTFYIASNLYADMGVHIPIMRSFSQGFNLPFELPFFNDKHLTYHFFYDFLAGVLEYSGLKMDISYNLILALILASLFFVCMDVGKYVFKKKWVGAIAFILFVLPSDLSFINVLKNVSSGSMVSLWHHNMYAINGFLGERTMGGFLYINTYLNQRHLLFAITASLAIFLPFWMFLVKKTGKKEGTKIFLIGFLISLILLWSVPVFLITASLFILLTFVFQKKLKSIGIGLGSLILFSLPQMLLITGGSKNFVQLAPGFLVHENLSLANFILLWIFNLGLGILTIAGGFIISNKNQKKLFLSLLPLFIFPNLFQIARSMFDNHKFFNFWFLYMCFFSANFLIYLFGKKRVIKILAYIIFPVLILSGFLNFLVVKNDVLAPIPDYSYNSAIQKIKKIIPANETVITNGEIFDPLSVAGRKTYLGRIDHIYSFGGDPQDRIIALDDLLLRSKVEKIENLSKKEGTKYMVIYKDIQIKNFKTVHKPFTDKTFKILYEDSFLTLYKL